MSDIFKETAVEFVIVAAVIILVTLLCSSCLSLGFQYSVSGISDDRVAKWIREVELKSGERYGYSRISVRAVNTGREAWSNTFRRPVGVFEDGMCGWTSGSQKSILVRLAVAKDGFLPDEYGIHEMAHALALSRSGKVNLAPTWKTWILGWHP